MGRYPESKNSLRKPQHDYRLPGYYLVTINTYLKQPLFSSIDQGILSPTTIGKIAGQLWQEIPQHEPSITLDAFVLMPDHLHGILQLTGNVYDILGTPERRQFQPETHSLSMIVRNYKAAVTRTVNQLLTAPPARIWQTSFHDRIIQDDKGLEAARWYICQNPVNWRKELRNEDF